MKKLILMTDIKKEPLVDQTKTEEQKTTETLHTVFDVIVEASQDPENHPAFEQLRQTVKTEFRKNCDSAIGIVNLAFSDEVIARSNPSLYAMIDRMERGETTFEEEDARLLAEWRALKANN